MDGDGALQGVRSLAQIESDLHKAEAAFADAAARLKEAERDRDTALETINRQQAEFDERVTELRRGSTPGSKWRTEKDRPEAGFILHGEDAPAEAVATGPTLDSESKKFGRAKPLRPLMDDGPLVKIKIQ